MNYQAGIKSALPFGIVFFTLPLIINALTGYTWEANLADTFKISRIITGIFMTLGYGLYIAKKQKHKLKMETSTKQDKLLFFGITFATLAALTYIVHYLRPISGISVEYIFLAPLFIAGIITSLKFGFDETQLKEKGATLYFISAITWSALSAIKWLKYFSKDNFDWIIASIFTVVAIVNWISFFRKLNK